MERQDFDGLFRLYEASFPDASETESREKWEALLAGTRDDGYTLAFALARDGEGVAGGIAYEYYPQSACGLLTYVFVAPRARRHGVARELIRRALEALEQTAGGSLRCVFAEAENPEEAAQQGIRSAIDPHERLEALARLGARRVDVPYVQPALEKGQPPALHLYLLLFHPPAATRLERGVLEAFLREFYASLGYTGPRAEETLAATLGPRETYPVCPLT